MHVIYTSYINSTRGTCMYVSSNVCAVFQTLINSLVCWSLNFCFFGFFKYFFILPFISSHSQHLSTLILVTRGSTICAMWSPQCWKFCISALGLILFEMCYSSVNYSHQIVYNISYAGKSILTWHPRELRWTQTEGQVDTFVTLWVTQIQNAKTLNWRNTISV